MSADNVFSPAEVFDSRDVIERIAYLTNLREYAEDPDATEEEFTTDDELELANLEAFASEAEGYGDWQYGETFIRDDYFEDYARELAEELGYMRNAEGQSWPYTHVDWEAAADELKGDYTSYEFDGETYWARS